jgi:hypothetical protein
MHGPFFPGIVEQNSGDGDDKRRDRFFDSCRFVAGMSAFCLALAWTSWMNARGK